MAQKSIKRERVRSFCFTLNNWKQEEYDWLAQKLKSEKVNYYIIGKEKGESGTPHLQGYVYFTNARELGPLLKWNPRIHWEVAKGSAEQSRKYCSKEGDFIEVGQIPQQGSRTDLTELRERCLNGNESIGEIVNEVKNFQQLRFAENLMKYRKPYSGLRWSCYLHGPTGIGKSRKAAEEAGEYDEVSYHNGFWVGYRGSKNVIINDTRGEIPFNLLLKILDRYPLYINIKGGETPWLAEKIWITSSKPPEEIYYNCGERIDQLYRRINESGGAVTKMTQRSGGNTEPLTDSEIDEMIVKDKSLRDYIAEIYEKEDVIE